MNIDNAIDMHREGIFVGIITCLKYYNQNISNKEIKEKIVEILKDWSKETLDYWFDWFGLNEEKLGEK